MAATAKRHRVYTYMPIHNIYIYTTIKRGKRVGILLSIDISYYIINKLMRDIIS